MWQRQAQHKILQGCMQEGVASFPSLIAQDAIITAQVAQPQAPHVRSHLILQPLPALHRPGKASQGMLNLQHLAARG